MKNPRTGILLLLSFAFLMGAGPSSCKEPAKSDVTEITILHTNDIHYHLRPSNVGTEDNPFGFGGLARLKTLVDQLRSQKKNTLLLDGGDWAEGTSNQVVDSGSGVLKIMDAIGYDAAAVGNHDFLNGPVELSNTIERSEARFPLVGANRNVSALSSAEQARFARNVKEYVIVNVGGVRVALVGLLCVDLVYYPFFKPGVVTNAVDKAAEITKKIKNQNLADVIVVLSHNSFESNKLWAKTIPWVNVIVSGHSHHKISVPYETTNAGQPAYVVEAQEWAFFLGELTLNVDLKNKTVKMKNYSIHPVGPNLAEDTGIAKMIEQKEQQVIQKFGRNIFTDRVAEAETDFVHPGKHENLLGNLLTDAYREATQSDVAIEISELSGHGFKGTLSTNDIFQAQPHIYSPHTDKTWTIHKMNITGANLKTVLNVGFLAQTLQIPLGWVPFSGAQITYSSAGGASPLKTLKVFNRATNTYEFVQDNANYTLSFTSGTLLALTEIFRRLGVPIDFSHTQDTGIEAWQTLWSYATQKQVLRMEDYEPGKRANTKEADLALFQQWVNLTKDSSNGYKISIRVQNNGLVAATPAKISVRRSGRNDFVNDRTALGQTIDLGTPQNVPALAPGQSTVIEFAWPTEASKPGFYSLRASLTDSNGNALSDGNTGNNTAARHITIQ